MQCKLRMSLIVYLFHDINSVQKLISNYVIEFYCMQPYLYSTLRVMLIVKFIYYSLFNKKDHYY